MASQKEEPITEEKKKYQDIEQYCAIRRHFVWDDLVNSQDDERQRATTRAEFEKLPHSFRKITLGDVEAKFTSPSSKRTQLRSHGKKNKYNTKINMTPNDQCYIRKTWQSLKDSSDS